MESWRSKKIDYIEGIENGERRFLTHLVEYREDGEEGRITGTASEVNKWYDVGWFEERVVKGAFDDVLGDDVRALFNHDPNLVLARTKSGTLDLAIDKKGNLTYSYQTPNRSYAKDLEDTVKIKDVDQSSFAFRVAKNGDKWEWRDDDNDLKKDRRTITKFERIYDVSPVTYAASPTTTVATRKLENHNGELKEAKKKRNENIYKLAQAKITLNKHK